MKLKVAGFFLILGHIGWAQQPPVFTENEAVPRFLTEAERLYLQTSPLRTAGVTPPPDGPLHTAAEYEPMDGILLSYQGPGTWKDILDQMAAGITTTGEADVYVMVDDASEANQARANMVAAGANDLRVHTIIAQTDTIWMRDYGPRYVYEGDVRVIIDHTYNRPRPFDNSLPGQFSDLKDHALYQIPLVHGGGNYHLHGTGQSHTTRLINNENPGLSEAQIYDYWLAYQNLDTLFYQPFPTNIDATQHIDMWMQAVADDHVVISDWPNNPGSTQDQICDDAATSLAQAGYRVDRIPARSVSGTHYTYTNVVMCNDLILVPSYTNASVSVHNAEALAAWQAAMPNKQIQQINCQAIVTAAGVMHCIVMHLPAPRGGLNPTAYLKTRLDGLSLDVGQQVPLAWIYDDDLAVTEVALELSVDGGSSWPFQVALFSPPETATSWTVPDVFSQQGLIRVVVTDGDGRTGSDQHEQTFTISGARPCPADVSPENGNGSFGDGQVNEADIGVFVAQWHMSCLLYDIAPVHGPGNYGDGHTNILDLIQAMMATCE